MVSRVELKEIVNNFHSSIVIIDIPTKNVKQIQDDNIVKNETADIRTEEIIE